MVNSHVESSLGRADRELWVGRFSVSPRLPAGWRRSRGGAGRQATERTPGNRFEHGRLLGREGVACRPVLGAAGPVIIGHLPTYWLLLPGSTDVQTPGRFAGRSGALATPRPCAVCCGSYDSGGAPTGQFQLATVP